MPLDAPPGDSGDLAGLLAEIERLETRFAGSDTASRDAAAAYRAAIEALHAAALRRLVVELRADPAAREAVRRAAADEIVYAVLRRHSIIKPSLSERVETALAGVRPMLASHGGDVELVSIMPPSVALRFIGSCDGCAASALTFHAGVKQAISAACPEITEIRQIKGRATTMAGPALASPFAGG
jgi:Fe-S cluster biogenesis protein NfuA